MSNFIDDNTSLPFPKTDAKPLGSSDPNKVIQAEDWNTVCQALLDTRDVIQGLLPNGDLPPDVASNSSSGTAGSHLARVTHTHGHGNQAGGSLHALATQSENGFMSATDKLKLDSITSVLSTTLNLYVATTGNDSTGNGSVSSPFATIQKAVDSIANMIINAPVTINIGPGTFAGFSISNVTFGNSGTLSIIGSTTVLASGTVSSASGTTSCSVVDSTANWTTDQWKGKFLTTTGTISSYSVIVSNSATTLSIPATVSSSFTGNYTIFDITTVIQGATPPSVFVGGVVNGLTAVTSSSGTTGISTIAAYRFQIRTIKIDQPTSGYSLTTADATVAFVSCHMSNDTTLAAILTTSTALFYGCYITSGINAGGGVIINLGNNITNKVVCVLNSYLRKTANLTSGIWISPSIFIVQGTALESGDTGLNVGMTSYPASNTSVWCINVTNPIKCSSKLSLTLICTGATVGVSATNSSSVVLGSLSNITATTGISAATGSCVQVPSSVVISATTELSVDGIAGTLATMRANTPKVFPSIPNVFGTFIYE